MLKKISKLAVGLVLAAGSASAIALDDVAMRKYVSVDYDRVIRDNDRHSLDGNGLSLGFGMPLSRKLGLETSVFFNKYGSDTAHPADWREYGVKLDGLFFPFRSRSFTPYLGLGLGGVHSAESTSNSSSNEPFVDAGVGFFKYFSIGSQDFAARADVRYRWLDSKINGVNELGEPILKVGLVLPFGSGGQAAAPVVAPVVAPAPAPEAAPAAPVVEAPAPAPVVEAPKDSDGDGVTDDQDTCPNTAPGTKVEVHGCPIEEKLRQFEAVHFDFDKSNLSKESKATLESTASAIKEMAKKSPVKVEVGGHTDNVGTDAYNNALSERRAKIVTKYLTKQGVDAKSITTNAYGETTPVETNETPEGRAANRRTEVKAKAE